MSRLSLRKKKGAANPAPAAVVQPTKSKSCKPCDNTGLLPGPTTEQVICPKCNGSPKGEN